MFGKIVTVVVFLSYHPIIPKLLPKAELFQRVDGMRAALADKLPPQVVTYRLKFVFLNNK